MNYFKLVFCLFILFYFIFVYIQVSHIQQVLDQFCGLLSTIIEQNEFVLQKQRQQNQKARNVFVVQLTESAGQSP